MEMVRHHHPRLKTIRLSILSAYNFLHPRGYFRSLQPTFALAAIQPCFERAATQRFVRLAQDRLPLAAAHDGKGIIEHETHKLRDVGRVEVRQVTALVPAEETAPRAFDVKPTAPLAFCLNESVQT